MYHVVRLVPAVESIVKVIDLKLDIRTKRVPCRDKVAPSEFDVWVLLCHFVNPARVERLECTNPNRKLTKENC